MKNYDRNKESPCFKYCDCDVNNLHRRSLSQKLPVGNFKWVQKPSEFNKDNKFDVQYMRNLHNLHNNLAF